jgi:hypothetical protein
MRRCLESQYVTSHLHSWIDLMFGLYTSKKEAMKRKNLFLPNIYINEKEKKTTGKPDEELIFFKEFGQLPRDLFARDL